MKKINLFFFKSVCLYATKDTYNNIKSTYRGVKYQTHPLYIAALF